ncbi:MAG: DUF423 domain-containing protein [Crocinitomicaceae bacterium]|jgi:uncharacterized membrane protein YgdD (TMEM256/DUF423 family)|nr:DUF423 domain-containing protein [Crocinitomicaceae bacterium]
MNKKIVLTSAILIATAIIFGAFCAHSLQEVLSPERMRSFEVGVRYQLFQGIALLVIGVNSDRLLGDSFWSARFIFFGILLFSCSIYLLALQGVLGVSVSFLGPITPIGGSLMLVGWFLFIKRIASMK